MYELLIDKLLLLRRVFPFRRSGSFPFSLSLSLPTAGLSFRSPLKPFRVGLGGNEVGDSPGHVSHSDIMESLTGEKERGKKKELE